jgi:hypothetical protein
MEDSQRYMDIFVQCFREILVIQFDFDNVSTTRSRRYIHMAGHTNLQHKPTRGSRETKQMESAAQS